MSKSKQYIKFSDLLVHSELVKLQKTEQNNQVMILIVYLIFACQTINKTLSNIISAKQKKTNSKQKVISVAVATVK